MQAYNEEDGAQEGLPEGEERMEILEQQAQPTNRPRITTRYMTKYERARILGTRALQIRCAVFARALISVKACADASCLSVGYPGDPLRTLERYKQHCGRRDVL